MKKKAVKKVKKDDMEKKVLAALKKAIDPETGIDVVTMKMIKDVEVKNNIAKIRFTPTTPFCPLISTLSAEIRQAALTVKGLKDAEVEVSF
jgi:metal-sulfur cluster biosynthetic enzyme